jgi:hypothetical protein
MTFNAASTYPVCYFPTKCRSHKMDVYDGPVLRKPRHSERGECQIRVSTNGPNTALKRNTLECARCELILEDKMMTCESSQASFSEYNATLSDTTN